MANGEAKGQRIYITLIVVELNPAYSLADTINNLRVGYHNDAMTERPNAIISCLSKGIWMITFSLCVISESIPGILSPILAFTSWEGHSHTGMGSQENFKKDLRSGTCALYWDIKEAQLTPGIRDFMTVCKIFHEKDVLHQFCWLIKSIKLIVIF